MKALITGLCVVLAIAPIFYLVLAAPLVWLFFDINIAPVITGSSHGEAIARAYIIVIVVPIWFFFWIKVADAIGP